MWSVSTLAVRRGGRRRGEPSRRAASTPSTRRWEFREQLEPHRSDAMPSLTPRRFRRHAISDATPSPRAAEAALVGVPHDVQGAALYAFVTLTWGAGLQDDCGAIVRGGRDGVDAGDAPTEPPCRPNVSVTPLASHTY